MRRGLDPIADESEPPYGDPAHDFGVVAIRLEPRDSLLGIEAVVGTEMTRTSSRSSIAAERIDHQPLPPPTFARADSFRTWDVRLATRRTARGTSAAVKPAQSRDVPPRVPCMERRSSERSLWSESVVVVMVVFSEWCGGGQIDPLHRVDGVGRPMHPAHPQCIRRASGRIPGSEPLHPLIPGLGPFSSVRGGTVLLSLLSLSTTLCI